MPRFRSLPTLTVATVQKTQPKIGGFTTVSSRPVVKTAVANDTSAVVNALGSSQTTTPAVEPTQTNSDEGSEDNAASKDNGLSYCSGAGRSDTA